MGTESLHIRDEVTGDCACGAMWVPSARDHPRSPATGPGRCWNEGTTQGDVWEVKQRLDELIEHFVKPMQVIIEAISPLLEGERPSATMPQPARPPVDGNREESP